MFDVIITRNLTYLFTFKIRKRCVSTEEIVKIMDLNVYYDLKRPLSRRNKATKTV
jgi:hypothetical protein